MGKRVSLSAHKVDGETDPQALLPPLPHLRRMLFIDCWDDDITQSGCDHFKAAPRAL